jgi:HTH-type transcriptional regulator, competence development regulator
VLQNTKQPVYKSAMRKFGETIRNLRLAQELGLRETASKIGISPAYLSRIERGKESPPRPEIIKDLAKVLAADPDVLFRLSSSTDPALIDFLHKKPGVINLLHFIKDEEFSGEEIGRLLEVAQSIKGQSHRRYQSSGRSGT